MGKAVNIFVVFALAFLSTVLGLLSAYGTKILDLGWSEWRAMLAAGISAVIVVAAAYADDAYKRFGRK